MNLAAERRDETLRLRASLEEHERVTRERAPQRVKGSGAATQELLRHFGYTGDEEPR